MSVRPADPIEQAAPAKINLFLHVIGRRQDGYHELATLMCPLADLYDRLTLALDQKGITVSCTHPGVPQDKTNLAHGAARQFLQQIERRGHGVPPGVRIHIEKQIPVAAGLGGGSSDAATVLMGLNRMLGNPFTQTELMVMGRRLGADVPFFILRAPAWATGIGDQLEPWSGLSPQSVVLITPQVAVSTADVYKNLNLGLTKCRQRLKYISFDKQVVRLHRILCNDLETVTAESVAEVGLAKAALLRTGAKGALMSGSGPTVFGLFDSHEAAQSARRHLQKERAWQVHLSRLQVQKHDGN